MAPTQLPSLGSRGRSWAALRSVRWSGGLVRIHGAADRLALRLTGQAAAAASGRVPRSARPRRPHGAPHPAPATRRRRARALRPLAHPRGVRGEVVEHEGACTSPGPGTAPLPAQVLLRDRAVATATRSRASGLDPVDGASRVVSAGAELPEQTRSSGSDSSVVARGGVASQSSSCRLPLLRDLVHRARAAAACVLACAFTNPSRSSRLSSARMRLSARGQKKRRLRRIWVASSQRRPSSRRSASRPRMAFAVVAVRGTCFTILLVGV